MPRYTQELKQWEKIKPTIKPTIETPPVPSPADFGISPVTDITATTRPQIDNYYYQIHFERDSVQINTLDLTPEKFQKALFEFFKRHSLAPQTP